MALPVWLFIATLWLAVLGVALGAGYLLTVLVREWRSGQLW